LIQIILRRAAIGLGVADLARHRPRGNDEKHGDWAS